MEAFIHIDCISEMRRRSLVFADAAQAWKGAKLNECGIKVPAIGDELRYTRLFYLLNRATVPQHYREQYLSLSMGVQSELLKQMREEGAPEKKYFDALLQYSDAHRERALAFLKRQAANTGWQGVVRRLQYFGDKLRETIPQRGFIITFSGVDGAGKSTVIEATRPPDRQRAAYARCGAASPPEPAAYPERREVWPQGCGAAGCGQAAETRNQ